jgi:hypothetical protein
LIVYQRSSQNQLDSAIYYAKFAFDLASTHNYKWDILESSNLLSDLYEKKDINKAYYYAQFSKKLNNNLYGLSKVNARFIVEY